MSEIMKMSKYNYYLYDNENNLIIYNFLVGLKSLIKVQREDVDSFKEIFLNHRVIDIGRVGNYIDIIDQLKANGILIHNNINENIRLEAKQYSEIFDNKLTLTILPTGNCNFKCPYCFETPQSFPRTTMTFESQKSIVNFVQKNIHNYRSLHISWFGGEPLLTPEIIKYLSESFIKICEMHHITYSADITTNGFLLKEDTLDMLNKLKVYDYMITIDGLKEQHDRRRFQSNGKGSYDQIIENILYFKKQKKYKFANIVIRVNMSMGFLEKMDEFLEFLSNNFLDDNRFQFLFVPVVKFSGSHFSDKEIYSDHNKLFFQLYKNDNYKKYLCSKGEKFSLIIPPKKCPSALKNTYVITPDLNVYKCNAHYDFKKNKIGFINKNGVLNIDESIHEQWFLTNRLLDKQLCNNDNCSYAPCCPNIDSGCPVSYLKAEPEKFECPMTNSKSKKEIEESILYMAKTYPCKVLNL